MGNKSCLNLTSCLRAQFPKTTTAILCRPISQDAQRPCHHTPFWRRRQAAGLSPVLGASHDDILRFDGLPTALATVFNLGKVIVAV
jgi:hypothetical protein